MQALPVVDNRLPTKSQLLDVSMPYAIHLCRGQYAEIVSEVLLGFNARLLLG